MCNLWNEHNRWLLERHLDLVNAPPCRFHEVYKKMPKTGIVYLFSFPTGEWIYVGVTVQKGGRMSSHRTNLKKGIGAKLGPYLKNENSRILTDDELKSEIGELHVRWIDEPNKGRQERIEAFTSAILLTPLNCQGRKRYGTAKSV